MASLKSAIREKCKDCIYDPLDKGTYLQQIEACTSESCALWSVRPLTIATITLQRKKNVNLDTIVSGLEDEETV